MGGLPEELQKQKEKEKGYSPTGAFDRCPNPGKQRPEKTTAASR
jgi:hypothetical protein